MRANALNARLRSRSILFAAGDERMARHLHFHFVKYRTDKWFARAAVLLIVGLQCALKNDLSLGPWWLGPIAELALLIPLSVRTLSVQRYATEAETDEEWSRLGQKRRGVRRLSVALTAVSSALNLGALVKLMLAILSGAPGVDQGRGLLMDAANIWAVNVIIFALWFWALDRGSPVNRGLILPERKDFLFVQQQASFDPSFDGWSSGFIDYVFLSFTNATAFSPSDTFPLTHRAKLLMMTESAISLVTITIVAARAVGILR